MKKSTKIVILVIASVGISVGVVIFLVVKAVAEFFGYMGPLERFRTEVKTDMALEKKYPEHDFDVVLTQSWGEFGYGHSIQATDEEGISFYVQWTDDEMTDKYHLEWNKEHYGKKLVDYQNRLRDELFPHIPYVDAYEYYQYDSYIFYRGPVEDEFFESMDDAIEASKYNAFNTDVTFKGIDLETADEEELHAFADSIAESLMWLSEETGYYDIRINNYYYREADEYGAGFATKDELAESVYKMVLRDRKINSNLK